MFFSLFLLGDRRIQIREAQKHMDPTDQGPQHWFLNWIHKNDLAHLDLSAKEDGILVHAEGHEEGGGGGIGGRVRQRDLRHQQPDIKQIM
jgi:hypothetical protein